MGGKRKRKIMKEKGERVWFIDRIEREREKHTEKG